MPSARELAGRLEAAIATEYVALSVLRPSRNEGGWSAKQEIGHLIDSAANNHLRFVVAAIEGGYAGPGYAQDAWVDLHGYADMAWDRIVALWQNYNQLLAAMIARIPEERLLAKCTIGGSAPVTLEYLIDDYIVHMQHHLDHALERASVTSYPR